MSAILYFCLGLVLVIWNDKGEVMAEKYRLVFELRRWLGCYHQSSIQSPNHSLTKLAMEMLSKKQQFLQQQWVGIALVMLNVKAMLWPMNWFLI